MDRNYFSTLFLLFSPFYLLFFHIVFVKINNAFLKNKFSNQKVAILSELFLNLPVICIFWAINKDFFGLIYCFIVYNSFGYAYFHLFNMTETARRIKILSEIREKQFVTKESLTENYKTDFMIKTRLNRLIELNQVRFDNEKYFVRGKSLVIAAISVLSLKKLLKL